MPLPDKVQTIKDIAVPSNKKQLTNFLGGINYYRDMWKHRSDILNPLTKMTSKQAIWNWTEEQQKAFEHMNKSISRETLLVCPNFSKLFVIHKDTSKVQLGAVISQDYKAIALFIRILIPELVNYTTIEQKLLSIAESLKELRHIFLGQQIKVYTDHKNLTYKSFNTEIVMRWYLILEEPSPKQIYIEGSKSIVADNLNCSDEIDNLNNINTNSNNNKVEPTVESVSENFALNEEDVLNPTSFKTVMSYEQKDKSLIEIAKEKPKDHSIKQFHWVGKTYSLICRHRKIMIPKQIQQTLIEWYPSVLCHPGKTRT